MTPDKLVQVATQAIRERFQAGELGGMEGAAKAALAAAFAALPECEEMRRVLIDAKLAGRHEAGEGYHFNTNEQAAEKALTAIAQEFGEPTP